MKNLIAIIVSGLLVGTPAAPVRAADSAQLPATPVQFGKGRDTATLTGRVQGYRYVDYALRAGAGQHLQVSLKAANTSLNFNVLPPDSPDAAMFIGQSSGDRFEGQLPDDGVYTLRVYLVRAAARRNAVSGYTLSVSITGKALPPLPAAQDALVAGTRFHAQTTVRCAPAYSDVKECSAGVVRRGGDRTATVQLQWGEHGMRRILFVKGSPVVADASQTMTFTRDDGGNYMIVIDDERFEIPEAFVFGG